MSGGAPAAPSPTARAAALAALTMCIACDAAPVTAAPVTAAPVTASAPGLGAQGDRGGAAGEPEPAPPATALPRPVEDGWIEAELRRYPARFDRWLGAAEAHRLQILVSVVEGQGDGRRLRRHGYRVDAEYVYPASALKPLLAVASLVTLRRLASRHGAALGPTTPLAPCLAGDGDCRALGDPRTSAAGSARWATRSASSSW